MFGCKSFAHVSKELRQKLDVKSTPCIFIGYGDEEFEYKLWNPVTKKIIRGKDIVFLENQLYTNFAPTKSSSSNDVGPMPLHFATNDEDMQDQVPKAEDDAY